jgi:hypothetical protein
MTADNFAFQDTLGGPIRQAQGRLRPPLQPAINAYD